MPRCSHFLLCTHFLLYNMFKYKLVLLRHICSPYFTPFTGKQYSTNRFSSFIKTGQQFLNMDSFIWIDMEMTGINPEQHTVLEIACIITTPQLEPVGDGFHQIIHQPDEILNSMNEWALKHHAQTGLTESSRKSTVTLSEADDLLSEYIIKHSKGCRYLSGNSVYMDRIFLMKYFLKTNSLLHYRIIDVSSIKILCSNWYPNKFPELSKKKVHRALSDIKESIQELKHYKEEIFK